jgi:hypothetical protein
MRLMPAAPAVAVRPRSASENNGLRPQAREVTLAEEKALLRHPIFLPAKESESDRSGTMDCNLRLWYRRR